MRTFLGILATAALLVISGVAPSSADVTTVDDSGDTGSASDVSKVRVEHTAKKLKVVVSAGRVRAGDEFDLWIDTPRGGAPDFHASIRPDAGYDAVRVARSWRRDGRAACRSWKARLSPGPDQRARFVIPRGCLGSPTRLRVSVKTTYSRSNVDWAPGVRSFSRWVAAS